MGDRTFFQAANHFRKRKIMLHFEPFSNAVLKRALPYIQKSTLLCSDLSAGSMFMWRNGEDVRFCIWNDTFVLQQDIGGQPAFTWPIGADPDGLIDKLRAYVRKYRLPLRFFAVDEKTLETIHKDKRLQPAMWAYDRCWSDYLYSFEEAMTFKGKKYSGQRNHINKFRRLYGEPVIRFLKPEDRPRLEAMLAEYQTEHPAESKMETVELEQAKKLLDSYSDFGLHAACMIVGDEIAAFSIGEIVGETLLIHVEKALRRYAGAYPTMYSGFVRLIAELLGHPLRLVNREDDAGDPGLRTSKQQYHPIDMVHKYLVHINSPAAKLEKLPVITSGGIFLTQLRESDKDAYLTLNTDIENNRFWGYDYREDTSIIGPVNENTFFDSVQYDMRVGDSINFAIRLNENGKMIGEGILWNFTDDGSVELGCRLLPAYHGKGYGKEAFGALAEFAQKTLGLRVWARCHLQNESSRRMITGNHFGMVRHDDSFYYFERDIRCLNQ